MYIISQLDNGYFHSVSISPSLHLSPPLHLPHPLHLPPYEMEQYLSMERNEQIVYSSRSLIGNAFICIPLKLLLLLTGSAENHRGKKQIMNWVQQ